MTYFLMGEVFGGGGGGKGWGGGRGWGGGDGGCGGLALVSRYFVYIALDDVRCWNMLCVRLLLSLRGSSVNTQWLGMKGGYNTSDVTSVNMLRNWAIVRSSTKHLQAESGWGRLDRM